MISWRSITPRSRSARKLVLVAAAVAAFLLIAAVGAVAHDQAVPAPPANPTSADEIQNIDQVKTAIKAYYGDTVTSTPAPGDTTPNPPGPPMLHTFSPTSAYAQEMARDESDWDRYLDHPSGNGHGDHHGHDRWRHDRRHTSGDGNGSQPSSGKPIILLDVDDTTLNTYSYEIYSNFVYNPATNANFVNAGSAAVFPAVPGMPDLVNHARADGYDVFFLTGRPESQRAGTIANLQAAGYGTVANDHPFMKDYGVDTWLSSCAQTCSTTQYKSLTRQHIESLGYDIVANFGDQFSDLNGGFEDQAFKVPNPMYYLP